MHREAGPVKVLSGGVSGDVVLTDEGQVRKQFLPKSFYQQQLQKFEQQQSQPR